MTPEQKRFNEILSRQKASLVKPELNVEINLDSIYKSLTDDFKVIFNEIQKMPVENFETYVIDYNFLEKEKEAQIQKVETQKEYSIPNSFLQQTGGSADEEEQPKRKRKFKR